MNDHLKYLFTNVNDWLKFAEAKNAGLIALNAVAVVGILQADKAFTADDQLLKGILILVFCISTALCLYSILPILNKWIKLYKKLDTSEFNQQKLKLSHIYFGDIAKLSQDQFINLFLSKISSVPIISEADKDLVSQIIINSEIALQKYKVFSRACWLTFVGCLIAIVVVIVLYLKTPYAKS